MYENLKNELKDIKIISMMCDLEEKIYEKINSICEKYGVEANCYDFDYSRVYKKDMTQKKIGAIIICLASISVISLQENLQKMKKNFICPSLRYVNK